MEQMYDTYKEALEHASHIVNTIGNVNPYFIYKNEFTFQPFMITDKEIENLLGWEKILTVYPYEPSEMTNKENG